MRLGLTLDERARRVDLDCREATRQDGLVILFQLPYPRLDFLLGFHGTTSPYSCSHGGIGSTERHMEMQTASAPSGMSVPQSSH